VCAAQNATFKNPSLWNNTSPSNIKLQENVFGWPDDEFFDIAKT